MKYDYLIVGAGLFGCVFARQMTDRGKKCLVIDKRDHIAGNCYTQLERGIHIHRYGAHIFHTDDQEVWDYVNRFGKFHRFINAPLANYKGKIFNLPFNMNTFYQMWGVTKAEDAAAIIEKQRKEAGVTEPENLEQQAISLVGTDIYRALVEGYTQKQWGRPCSQLPAFLIRRLPVRYSFDNNYFAHTYQGIPTQGYTALAEKLLEGIEVQLQQDYLLNREYWDAQAEKVLYTGTIDGFFGYALGKLEYRSLGFETETLEIPDYQGNAVVNYTDAQTPYTRIIEHKHFAYTQCRHTVITREYPLPQEAGQEPYYPVNDEKNQALLARYQDLAGKQSKVIFGGRLGLYKYLDMDQVVRAALDLANTQ